MEAIFMGHNSIAYWNGYEYARTTSSTLQLCFYCSSVCLAHGLESV